MIFEVFTVEYLLKMKLRGRKERKKDRKRVKEREIICARNYRISQFLRAREDSRMARKGNPKNYRPIIYYVICVARYTERKINL